MVTLADPYFQQERLLLDEPELLCNPVSKNNEPISDPTAHLLCYDLDGFARKVDRRVVTVHQLGMLRLHIHRADTLCVPAEKDGVDSALNIDHFKCYNAHRDGGPRFRDRDLILRDQFFTDKVEVEQPENFCTAVDKNGEGIRNASARLVCHDLDDARDANRTVTTRDQFGELRLKVDEGETLCLPSVVQPMPPSKDDDDEDDQDD
jgi:hypothetical protein